MKKIFMILCCFLLVSCSSEKELKAIEEEHARELDRIASEIKHLRRKNNNRIKAFEEALDTLVKEQEIIKHREHELLKSYNEQKEAYARFDHVYKTANQELEVLLLVENSNYPDYNYESFRLDDLSYLYDDEDLDITIYSMNYAFKSLTPEHIIFTGPMQALEDGWILTSVPDSHYLIFREDTYLGMFSINDASPKSQAFKKALKDFVKKESNKLMRMDFIDGDLLYSYDMFTKHDFEFEKVGHQFYTITGGSEGFAVGVFQDDFDIESQKPNHSSIIKEETFDLNLGKLELITLDADLGTTASNQGTYLRYLAYLKISDKEGYFVDFTRYDKLQSTKFELIAMLNSMTKRDLINYEEISLKNVVVSSKNDVNIVLIDGYFTNDAAFWNAYGPKWVGDFEVHVSIGDEIVKTSLNDLWFYDNMFFYAPEFELELKDYNHDGLMDFALSQYGATNIDFYMLFTILEDGQVIKTPMDVEVITGHTTRDNSPKLVIENNQITSTFYDNTATTYYKDYYKWDGQIYKHIKREALDD